MKLDRTEFTTSRFLKAADLLKARTTTTIENVTRETLRGHDGDREKIIVAFTGLPKPLPLNITNMDVLLDAYGDDTDEWIGRGIVVMKMKGRDPAGRSVDVVRLDAADATDEPEGDDVPF